jgi:basic amino acid/polyamine antiporter, APA family
MQAVMEQQVVTTNDAVSPAGRPKLKRSLGLWMTTALVVGNMIGSGIFLLPASLAAEAGPVSILGWVFTGVGAILLALVFANLGRALPKTGGPYAYSRHAFGDFVGFQTAWGYWIAAWVGNAAITYAFVSYLSVFWTELATNNVLAAIVGISTIWLLTLVNIWGVKQSGIVQLVTTILKFVPLALIAIIGIFFMNGDNFTPFSPHGSTWSGLSIAATLTLWAFIGLESATVPAEEVKNPKKTLPRATVLGTVITTIVYLLATIAIMGVVSTTVLAGSNAPFALAANEIFGGRWGDFVAAIAMISAFGCLNGWILLTGRVSMAAAEDGLFPKFFAKVHGERRTPVLGLIVAAVFISILMVMQYNSSLVDQFTFVLLLATLTTLVPYAYSAAAQLQMLFTDRELFSGRKLAVDAGVAMLALAFAIWAIYGAGYEVIAKGFLLLMLGVPVYVYMKWRGHKSVDPDGTVVLSPPLTEDHPTVMAS